MSKPHSRKVCSLGVAGGLFLASIATPTSANWQYTTWGSTPDQVVQASNGRARPNPDRGKDPLPNVALLTTDYEASGVLFRVYFVFDPSNRLKMVDMSPVDPRNCDSVVSALSNSYGAPGDTGGFGLMKWWNKPTGNIITYSRVFNCYVRYRPYTEPGASGGL